tara:strand:- start:3301 stop:4263 length:963 start_codon:yes stop_codon:yes gene_type:complete
MYHAPHHSWKDLSPFDPANIPAMSVPEYSSQSTPTPEDLYDVFHNRSGCFIVRSMYSVELMDAFNTWCSDTLQEASQDGNSRHPIQKGKLLINNLLYRLSRDDPDMLMDICNHPTLTTAMDVLLGFGCFGSATAHWIEPGGERQLSHVDYPIHLASSPFWGQDVSKLKRYTTRSQINTTLPHHSIQILIATDDTDVNNGSTQVVPGSQSIPDIDVHIQGEEVKRAFEPLFQSVSLKKGDILFFNRHLVHRGGYNASAKRRNALILQCVHLWSIPQELHPYEQIKAQLAECGRFGELSVEEREEFLTRIKQPYPKDVTMST